MPTVLIQKWEESERGWGTRPDGYSMHQSEEAREAFVKAYWASMPDSPPDDYSRPKGTPYMTDVDNETFDKVKRSWPGMRFYDNNYPGDGGPDGWVNRSDSRGFADI